MQEVRLNLYQCNREFQIEIGGGGFGYRLLGPKFDGSSRLIKSVILSDRDKEEIIGYVKPDARAIEEELADYKAANASIREELRCRIKERDKLAAENKRLAALNDMFPQEIARLEDRVSAEYEAERADDRAKIEELKKENRRLRELVDGATVAVELFKDTAPAQKKWREEWLNKAREALKEASHD